MKENGNKIEMSLTYRNTQISVPKLLDIESDIL